jgi:hypothetical protein
MQLVCGSCCSSTTSSLELVLVTWPSSTCIAIALLWCVVTVHAVLCCAVLCCAVCSFISEFLGSLCSDTRKSLATVARLENYKKDQVRGRTLLSTTAASLALQQGTKCFMQHVTYIVCVVDNLNVDLLCDAVQHTSLLRS